MKVDLTPDAMADYKALPEKVAKAFQKQIGFLKENLRHPSLRSKKYITRNNRELWQARVDQRYRFYFEIRADLYMVLKIKDHPK